MQPYDNRNGENQLIMDENHSSLIHSTTPHLNKQYFSKSSKSSLLNTKPTTSTLMGRPKQMMLHDITNSNCKTPVLRQSSKLGQVAVSLEDLDQSNEFDQMVDELGEIENANIVNENEFDNHVVQYDEELQHLIEIAKSHYHKIEGFEFESLEKNRPPTMLVDEPDFVGKVTNVMLLPF